MLELMLGCGFMMSCKLGFGVLINSKGSGFGLYSLISVLVFMEVLVIFMLCYSLTYNLGLEYFLIFTVIHKVGLMFYCLSSLSKESLLLHKMVKVDSSISKASVKSPYHNSKKE